jgi:hypothetical protein
MRRSVTLGLAAMTFIGVAAAVAAADSIRWTLHYRNEAPTWVTVPAAGGKTKVAWVMAWTVTNKTGAERTPSVHMTLHGPKDQVFADGQDAAAVAAAKRKWKVETLATASSLKKGIADGAEVKGVATFGAVDDLAKEVELRVHGLRDNLDTVAGKTFHETSYWSVKYQRKGDEFRRTEDAWKEVSSGWVVESRVELPPKTK